MLWWQAFWLGLTQGLTEFLPISSSGHLEIMQSLMGGATDNSRHLLEVLNIGTLLVLIIYYRHRIVEIVQDVIRRKKWGLLVNIIITCIPAGLAGLLLSDFIDNSPFFASEVVLAIMMALLGIVMIVIDRLPRLSRLKDETKLSHRRALYIGLAQMLALIPGTSRSGTTIVAGRLVGLDNKSAADYSFLASIPLMIGVVCHSLLSEETRTFMAENLAMVLFANILAFAAGGLIIKWALRFLRRKDALKYFGWYRVILATTIIIFLLLK